MTILGNRSLSLAICVLSLLVFCSAASAKLKPDGTVQSVQWHSDEHPITGKERIDFVVTTRQHGDFNSLIRVYAELEDPDGAKYVATSAGKFSANFGDRQLTRISHFYIANDAGLKVKAYWVGFYYVDKSDEYLLSDKNKKIDDFPKWKEAAKKYKKAETEVGSTELKPAI